MTIGQDIILSVVWKFYDFIANSIIKIGSKIISNKIFLVKILKFYFKYCGLNGIESGVYAF